MTENEPGAFNQTVTFIVQIEEPWEEKTLPCNVILITKAGGFFILSSFN